jgi:hypothetical protein
VFDGNLHWNVATNKPPKRDILKMAREHKLSEQNKKHYAPGWAANSVVADPKMVRVEFDPAVASNFGLQKGSPAVAAGIILPEQYEDPFRPEDGKRPDVGAIPFSGEPLRVGIDGRIVAGRPVAP